MEDLVSVVVFVGGPAHGGTGRDRIQPTVDDDVAHLSG